jgi:hypothetical protein
MLRRARNRFKVEGRLIVYNTETFGKLFKTERGLYLVIKALRSLLKIGTTAACSQRSGKLSFDKLRLNI